MPRTKKLAERGRDKRYYLRKKVIIVLVYMQIASIDKGYPMRGYYIVYEKDTEVWFEAGGERTSYNSGDAIDIIQYRTNPNGSVCLRARCAEPRCTSQIHSHAS